MRCKKLGWKQWACVESLFDYLFYCASVEKQLQELGRVVLKPGLIFCEWVDVESMHTPQLDILHVEKKQHVAQAPSFCLWELAASQECTQRLFGKAPGKQAEAATALADRIAQKAPKLQTRAVRA